MVRLLHSRYAHKAFQAIITSGDLVSSAGVISLQGSVVMTTTVNIYDWCIFTVFSPVEQWLRNERVFSSDKYFSRGSSSCLKTGVRKSLVQNINYSLTHRSDVGSTAVRLQTQCRYSCETGQIMKSAYHSVGTNTSGAVQHRPLGR